MKIKNRCDPRYDVNKTLNLVGTYRKFKTDVNLDKKCNAKLTWFLRYIK